MDTNLIDIMKELKTKTTEFLKENRKIIIITIIVAIVVWVIWGFIENIEDFREGYERGLRR